VTNSRQPNRDPASSGQASSSATAGRGPAASVEMWQSNAAPVRTPHAVNASPSYPLTSHGPGALRASAKACAKPTRPVNHFLRRKSLLRKAIHRPGPREPHPASHGQYVTVTQGATRR
jgi:hypothetical protein